MYRHTLITVLMACMTLTGAQAQAQDDEIYPPDESVPAERCIGLNRLGDTEILDNRNILFRMKGGKTYRNVLPRRCPSLRKNEAFSYQATMNRLCDNDMITILIDPGMGRMNGPVCVLGKFYPISEAEVDALREEMEKVEELGLEEPK